MSKKPIHTVHNPNWGWDNKRQGSDRAISHSDTKEDATKAGRDQARRDGTEHFIHNKDGKFSERNNYGNDPFPPRG